MLEYKFTNNNLPAKGVVVSVLTVVGVELIVFKDAVVVSINIIFLQQLFYSLRLFSFWYYLGRLPPLHSDKIDWGKWPWREITDAKCTIFIHARKKKGHLFISTVWSDDQFSMISMKSNGGITHVNKTVCDTENS